MKKHLSFTVFESIQTICGSGSSTFNIDDITMRLKIVPSYIITSYLAGEYFQVLRNIIAPGTAAKFLVYYAGMRV